METLFIKGKMMTTIVLKTGRKAQIIREFSELLERRLSEEKELLGRITFTRHSILARIAAVYIEVASRFGLSSVMPVPFLDIGVAVTTEWRKMRRI